MEQESKLVVLHCQDTRGRDMEKYKVFGRSVTFNFERGAKINRLLIIEDDQELYREELGECYVPEEGGNLVIDLSKVEV